MSDKDPKDLTVRGANEVSQDEIERIWRATEWMSPQTPLEIRRVMLILKENGIPISVTEQMLLTVMTDIRAALTKDESKFAHLVAGTETIVSTLQEVNPLNVRLDKISQENAMLRDQVDDLEAKLDLILEKLGAGASAALRANNATTDDRGEEVMEHRESAPEELAEAQEKYDARIGSAWAKAPEQGPLYAFVCEARVENGPCEYVYRSGRLKNDDGEDFHCPLHNTPLSFVGETHLNDSRQFRKEIREKL
jgi:hypothetical protein